MRYFKIEFIKRLQYIHHILQFFLIIPFEFTTNKVQSKNNNFFNTSKLICHPKQRNNNGIGYSLVWVARVVESSHIIMLLATISNDYNFRTVISKTTTLSTDGHAHHSLYKNSSFHFRYSSAFNCCEPLLSSRERKYLLFGHHESFRSQKRKPKDISSQEKCSIWK
ncbi:unnamed protein product [Lupinus luteus]|uniref:Uncharacterized protein n=1 Tax=Lupinus luteus TaxID=3873 RepID=A0AAV1W0R1_LUPLU